MEQFFVFRRRSWNCCRAAGALRIHVVISLIRAEIRIIPMRPMMSEKVRITIIANAIIPVVVLAKVGKTIYCQTTA